MRERVCAPERRWLTRRGRLPRPLPRSRLTPSRGKGRLAAPAPPVDWLSGPWRLAAAAAAFVCGLILLATAAACSSDTSITPPTAPPDNATARAQAGQRALDAFARGLRSGQPASAVASTRSTGLVPAVTANARALGLRSLSFDYVDTDDSALGSAGERKWGSDAWVGIVATNYRLSADNGPTQMEIAVTFTREQGTVRIAAIGGHGHRSALWLDGPITVRHRGAVWIIDADSASAGRFLGYGLTAVRQVRMVLPRWHGSLVLEIPADEPQLNSVLDADASTYTDIAGITTTADGAQAQHSPIHVFINQAIFGSLKRRGAQVVMTHETTHVATKAPLTDVPTWLSEGFADYVGLDHADVPLRTAAAQIIKRVRAHGLPKRLPTSTDLAPTAEGLGATYEEAWTVCRYLGDAYGEARLVAFYQGVSGGMSLARAFRVHFGVDQAQVVAGWRAWLGNLAGVA